MFEKEAEKYASKGGLSREKHLFGIKAISFKDGAKFGYNKAKEELEKEKCELLGIIQEKDKVIAELKCCKNCLYNGECDLGGYEECKNFDKWEKKE